MGLLPTGILGVINGSVGPVVTYQVNGQNVIRSKGNGPSGEPTTAQLTCRGGIKILSEFFNKNIAFLKQGFDHLAQGTTLNYHNLAMRYNKPQALSGEYPDMQLIFENIVLSKGNLAQPVNPTVARVENGLKFSWENDSAPDSAYYNDQVMMLAYSPKLDLSAFISSGAKRKMLEDVLAIGPTMLKQQLEIYISFIADNRLQAADSMYLGSLSAV